MPKHPKDFIDWENTPIIEPPHKLSEPVKKARGEQAIVDQFAQLVRKKFGDPGPNMRQPTKEEQLKMVKAMFPNLPETREEFEKREKDWLDGENPINKFFREVQKPITSPKLQKSDFGRGAVNTNMSEEEKRAKMTDEEYRIHQIAVQESNDGDE